MIAVTLSGWTIDTDTPDVSGVSLGDVWRAYSQLGRWAGQTRFAWSVGDHVLAGLPYAVRAGVGREWLLHEAAEALAFGDIPSPLRTASYNNAEHRLLRAVFKRWGLTWPPASGLKLVDKRLAATEARQLLHASAWRQLAALKGVAPYKTTLTVATAAQVRRRLERAAREVELT